MKLIVQTTTNVHLMDPTNGQEIHWNRPSVVSNTSFLEQKIGAGVVEVLNAKLSDKATDEEFAKFFAESDKKVELAVESFVAKFGITPEEVEEKKVEEKKIEKKGK